jgi:hypothetical protein
VSTPFDEQMEEANQANEFGFSDDHKGFSSSLNQRQDKSKIVSDNPFEDDDDDQMNVKNIAQEKTGIWKGMMNWGSSSKPKTDAIDKIDFSSSTNKPISEADAFDKELDDQKKGKYSIKSPFEIRVEDKVESTYEYIGRTFKKGVKKFTNLDKKIQNWANGVNTKDQFMEREHEMQAEAVSNSINTFMGGNTKLNQISIDVNKKSKLNVHEIKQKLEKDKPLKFKIKTKQDFYEQKKKEKILNPFENEFEENVVEFPDLNKINQSAPPSQPIAQVPQISTPFLDDFMSESDSKNIFGTTSMSKPKKSNVKIFDDDDDGASIFPSRQLNKVSFGQKQKSSGINQVMSDDFLNFGGAKSSKQEKDPFESVFD